LTRRIFVDTEWTAPPWAGPAELMWLGLADENGNSWYGISAEVDIDPETNRFIAGAFGLIDRNEPRLTRSELAIATEEFCEGVTEFWAWVPSLGSFRQDSALGDQAAEAYGRWWDIDLQMLRTLVNPWPSDWPHELHDLNKAAHAAQVAIPEHAANHLHPRVHALWNRDLFRRIKAAADANQVPSDSIRRDHTP
jgi:hypothetical protein